MCKDAFYIIGLFDFDADADCIDRGLDQDLLILVAGDMHWIQDDLGRGSDRLAGKSDKIRRGDTWLRLRGCCVVQRLGWRSFRDIARLSDSRAHS